MRTWLLGLALVACSADDDDGENPENGGDDDTAQVSGPRSPCADVPTYDVPSLGCTGLNLALDDIVAAAEECEVPADCKAIRPACEVGLGSSCWLSVNTCLSDQIVADLNGRAAELVCPTGAVDGTCKCSGAPEVDCVSGRCSFQF